MTIISVLFTANYLIPTTLNSLVFVKNYNPPPLPDTVLFCDAQLIDEDEEITLFVTLCVE